jgi:hypothetical protein
LRQMPEAFVWRSCSFDFARFQTHLVIVANHILKATTI